MTRKKIKEAILEINPNLAFTVNVITHHHTKPVEKLRKLLALLRDGSVIYPCAYSMNEIWIDSKRTEITEL